MFTLAELKDFLKEEMCKAHERVQRAEGMRDAFVDVCEWIDEHKNTPEDNNENEDAEDGTGTENAGR